MIYEPDGSTALYDALGLVFDEYGSEDNVIVLINTDGQDNTSMKWNRQKIKEKIEKLKQEKGWIFEFAAANQDAWAVGNDLGLDTSINYVPTPQGLRTLSVQVKGPGSGRETALRSLQSRGFKILSIKDTTPMPHNGARPPKRRRV